VFISASPGGKGYKLVRRFDSVISQLFKIWLKTKRPAGSPTGL
jgi:hypothetical protein